MLGGTVTAGFLSACLIIFFAVNVYSWLKAGKSWKDAKSEAEVELPHNLVLALAALGTGVFFVESASYVFFVTAGLEMTIRDTSIQLMFPFDSWVQVTGIVTTAFGYALFLWSVLARGKYATSWEMPGDQKLVTWGPYKYVRHPSYLAYFIMFVGLFLLLLHLAALIPLVAVPGYVSVTTVEDEMLRRRFGGPAVEYQSTTGRFLPRRRRTT
jgi:protein-S-isoprenylcysteine O-methyltransferase Ste14